MTKIYLIGYMGSGKSTAGKKLAKKLEFDFVDMDSYIETENNLSIPEIFKSKGEKGFRELEQLALSQLSKKDNVVISCGGGTPCFNDNMEVMNATGTAVYLKMNVDALVSRLLQAKEKRPLIKNKTENELRSFISRQLEKREEFYSQAKYSIEGSSLDVDDLVELVKS